MWLFQTVSFNQLFREMLQWPIITSLPTCDEVDGESRVGSAGRRQTTTDGRKREHVDGERRRLTKDGDLCSVEQHSSTAHRVQVPKTLERTVELPSTCRTNSYAVIIQKNSPHETPVSL